jgi:hypothetical protein
MKIDDMLQAADQEEMRRLLEGHESLLIPAVQKAEERYASMTCPECGSPCRQVVDADRPFTPGKVLPNILMHCTYCRAVFEPDTGLIIHFGEAYTPLPTSADLFIRVNEPEDLQDS